MLPSLRYTVLASEQLHKAAMLLCTVTTSVRGGRVDQRKWQLCIVFPMVTGTRCVYRTYSNLVLKARQLSPLFVLLFFYCVLLVFTAFALGLLVFLISLGLLVFLTFAVTFKKPHFCIEKAFASGLLVFLTFAVTFKKPFCMEKTVLHQAFWSF